MNESIDSASHRTNQKDDRKSYAKGVKKHGSKRYDDFMQYAKDDRENYKNKMKFGKNYK